ncbi:F-box only protein 15 [Clarias gariepinus]|uniref:F-box only protein 15 n=1 Tax=Clarias gariepinus TaxID=13013 RepID=UPI00234E292C|nr:F-box only protein 15 [Clarias gariepinus]
MAAFSLSVLILYEVQVRCMDDKTTPPPSPSKVSQLHFDYGCMENFFKRLPPEIILKIFSYLDAPSLFCVGFVNRQFHELANDNVMWYELYTCEMGKRKWRSGLCDRPDSNRVDLQDVPARVWKKLLLSEMRCHDHMVWKKELRYVNLHTGMPELTEQVLRSQQVVWELTLCKLGGKQIVYSQSQAIFFDSSVAVYWSSGKWPRIQQVYSLQVHGVLGSSTTMPAKPQWRSLISKTVSKEMKWKHIGVDSLGTWEIAFVMATLHHHKLVERSVLGSLFCTYRAEDISPLHTCLPEDFCVDGYTVIMLLHNSSGNIVKCRYSPVFCAKDKIHSGFVYLQPVKISISQKHTLIPDEISFSWKINKLWGDIKNCCMMTVSVLDEARKPVWCISTSAAIVPHRFNAMCDNYEGEQFVLWCEDAHGKLKMILVWMQDLHVYCIISLHIWIREENVNTK